MSRQARCDRRSLRGTAGVAHHPVLQRHALYHFQNTPNVPLSESPLIRATRDHWGINRSDWYCLCQEGNKYLALDSLAKKAGASFVYIIPNLEIYKLLIAALYLISAYRLTFQLYILDGKFFTWYTLGGEFLTAPLWRSHISWSCDWTTNSWTTNSC
jgi:hypothetical protein